LTLYWKRCSTAGVVAGVVGGTLLSISLVLISPNMTYPMQVKKTANSTIADLEKKLNKAETGEIILNDVILAKLKADLKSAQTVVSSIHDGEKSIVGLSEPLITLRNPGIISIPVGFALVIIFSMLFPSGYSKSRWAELAVRRETGYGAAQATSH